MKRLALALTTAAALLGSGGTASAVIVDTYTEYCGFTVVYPCGQCVVLGATTRCVYYA